MQDFLTKYPSGKINFLYGQDDPMAMGGLQAIKGAAARRNSRFTAWVIQRSLRHSRAANDRHIAASEHLWWVCIPSVPPWTPFSTVLSERDRRADRDITKANIDLMYQVCW